MITPVARGVPETKASIMNGVRGIGPMTLFPVARDIPLPVGEIHESFHMDEFPRTHKLALIAAEEAMADSKDAPDAIVIGGTTGGMPLTEKHLKKGDTSRDLFKYHATGSVAEYLAAKFKCKGPVITVSTACSSGTAALKVALEMLREGKAENVLVGGADSLCRLTYYGFNALQLIDPAGARPFDINRRGMTVSEGAGMLLLEGKDKAPNNAMAEILGAGLSCDAYHPSSPDPEGTGALAAMRAAIKDGDISPSDIDYVNLHGTGTIDNDLSEAMALHSLFAEDKPLLSSVKGAFGHSLAAAGAIEAVISAMGISDSFVPGNTGCNTPDPELHLNPVIEPIARDIQTVLSNSFGFGGNNASVVIGRPEEEKAPIASQTPLPLTVVGSACITGAGKTRMTEKTVSEGRSCKGKLSEREVSKDLSPKTVRRLKRLSRLALSLAISAHKDSGASDDPNSIFFGTGWGPLSDTYDFLTKLYESEEHFTSPIDFIGSVHNAPAGLIAIRFRSTGPNITTTGGDYSFEQSLMAAGLLTKGRDDLILLVGADESHEILSGLFDDSVSGSQTPSDGGGALCLRRTDTPYGLRLFPSFFENSKDNPSIILSLIDNLGGLDRIKRKYGAVFAGIPGSHRETGSNQLSQFLSGSRFEGPVIDYRRLTGEFASASAVATVLAVCFAKRGKIPEALCNRKSSSLNGKGILIIGLGKFVTAVEVIT